MRLKTRHVIYGMLAGVLFVILLIHPAAITYVPAAIFTVLFVAYVVIAHSFHLAVQKTIDDTYRIPGTEIVLRTTFANWSIATAPYLEVRVGDQKPHKYCLAGPALTRAQLYAVEGGRVLVETARDTFLISSSPFSVEGPPSWMFHSVKVNQYGSCDYDARSDASLQERAMLKSQVRPTYVGAFDMYGKYWKFWPALESPEQRIVP